MKVDGTEDQKPTGLVWLGVIGYVYLLLVAVGTITAGFQWAVGRLGLAGRCRQGLGEELAETWLLD